MPDFRHATYLFLLLELLVAAGMFRFGLSPLMLAIPVVLYGAALTAGSFFINLNFYVRSRSRGGGAIGYAITFDDGPHPQTGPILDVLKARNIRATFFFCGDNIARYPALARRAHEEGHAIGNHTRTHSFFFDLKSARAMREEISQTDRMIAAITGYRPRFFRPPYGVTNPPLARAIRDTGHISVAWTFRTFDTVLRGASRVGARVARLLRPGTIMVLHDHNPAVIPILEEIIDRAEALGYRAVRLDELLNEDNHA
jgi:peptidoglycan-N-acetylglucosamine deacetylase